MNNSGYEARIRKELLKNVEDALNNRILENGKRNVLTFKNVIDYKNDSKRFLKALKENPNDR